MKTKGKAWQLVLTVLLIAAFVYTAFFGVAVKYGDVTTTYIKGAKDIRFGVDIKGGVNVTFVPSDGYDATDDQLEAAQLVIENRLVALNVTDYELYVDNNSDSLILEFPWQSGETEFDPEAAIEEIGTTAYLTFREGSSADGELVLDGSMVESAAAQYGPVNGSSSEYYVALKFTDEGAKAFGDATTRLYQTGGTISIWLDDENVSTASVNAAITDGSAIITSSASNPFTQEDVVKMARQINSGSLPFALTVDSYSTISPSLGENSLSAMVLAGVIAFALIVVLMTALYRLPGFLACIALAGQVAATLAFVSGYFPVFESFTLTLTRELRVRSEVGIILITGRNDEIDRIVGLECGADDYVIKPLNPRELVSRAKNLIRRVRHAHTPHPVAAVARPVKQFAAWALDTDRRRLIDHSGSETLLTHGEYQLLSVFLRNSGHTLSRDQLMDQIRNREWVPNDRSIDVLVGRLRRKLHDDPAEPELIITIHGAGYLFTASVAA